MSDALGILAKAAFRKDRGLYGAGPAIAYPDTPGAADLAATHLVPFSSEGLAKAIERGDDAALIGGGGANISSIVAEDSAGSLTGPLAFRGWERIVMCALGFEHPCPTNGSPQQLGVTTAYAHLFEIDEILQDQAWSTTERGLYTPPSVNDRKVRRGMLGLAKQVNDWVWQSVMISKITIKGDPKKVEISVDYIAYDYVKGSYNSANWTAPAGSVAKCLFQQCVIKVGARVSGVGGLVEYSPSSWELVLDNKLKGDDRTTTSGVNIEQPDRSDKFDVDLKLEFPRYNATGEGLIDLGEANVELAGSVEITGPQIAATGYNRSWGFFMSSLWQKDSSQSVDKPGPLTQSVNFRADKPGGSDIFDATKYHSITTVKDSPLVVVAQNEDSGNYLLET